MEKIIHNVDTDEIIIESLSELEIEQLLKSRQENEKLAAKKEAEELALIEKRNEILAKLGITEEEAKLLLS